MSPDAFRALAAAFPEPLLLVANTGEILAVNSAAGRLFDKRPAQLIGLNLGQEAEDPEALSRFLIDASATGTMIPGRMTLRTEGGGRRELQVEGAAVRPDGTGRPTHLVLRCRERTDVQDRFSLLNQQIDELSREIRVRMRLEADRERLLASEQGARAEAERANRLKDEFLATLSHELRTPLNAIMGWSSMLRLGVGKDQFERGLETIHRAARSQTQLVDDILDVSRIITGKLRLDLRPVNVTDAVQAAADSVEPTARAKGVRLQVMMDTNPGPVSADADRIQQVAWNLLSNAIKFTPRGGLVQVRVEQVNSQVEVIVSDTGEGIDPSILPFVFDRFRQGEGSLTRTHQGLGLGLSIVRHLVEAHAGSVQAHSAGRGLGATFTVVLPLLVYSPSPVLRDGQDEHPRPEVDVTDVGQHRLEGWRILVVEDEQDSREMLTNLFESVGAEARAVRTAADALIEVESFVPDVIVSDIELIGEDGYMLARRLRALPPERGGRIPAVALTAYARSMDRVRALDAGFQMHLPKPVEPGELLAVVASLARGPKVPSDPDPALP